MELSPELKVKLGKRAIELFSLRRNGQLPSQSEMRDPDVFLPEEFAQALAEERNVEKVIKEVRKEESEKPVSKSKKKS